MAFDESKFIRPGDFCYITTDKFTDQGVPEGDVVYVIGQRAIPENEDDPYTQRIKFFIHRTDDDNHVLFDNIYIMDPKSLERIDGKFNEELVNILSEDVGFMEQEPPSDAVN